MPSVLKDWVAEFDFSGGVTITLWRPRHSDAGSDAGSIIVDHPKKQLPKKDLEEMVLSVSKDGLSLDEIAKKVGRSKDHLRNRIIPGLIESGKLKRMFPDNDPNQRFITVKK